MSEVKKPTCFTQEELDVLEKQFNKDFNTYNENVQSFSELISNILVHETAGTFERKTGLSQNMLSRMKNQISKKDPPKRNTLMSVCVGYNIDLPLASRLFDSLGVAFSYQSKRDYAYVFLLTECRGKSIDECNEILERLGIEECYWLGSHARYKR